jgi:cytoskeletal protein CcmA (bactofilin family)
VEVERLGREAMRGRVGRFALAGLLAAGVVAAWANPAVAQVGGDRINRNDQIVLNGRLIVPKGQSVESAVILNGPATIDGTVQETLFVLRGRADVSGTVQQDVVVVRGTAVIRSGAHVGGDIVTQTAPTIENGATVDGRVRSVSSRFDVNDFRLASRFVWWVGYSASTLFLGLLLLLLFPGVDAAATRAWRERAGAAVGWGVGVFFLFPILAVVSLVTVVGIPLGLFMLLAIALIYSVGYVVGCQVLGRLLIKPPTSRFLAFLVGWVILRVIGLVPILGGLAFLVAALVGLGSLAVAARRPVPAGEAPPPPPPPVPAPV